MSSHFSPRSRPAPTLCAVVLGLAVAVPIWAAEPELPRDFELPLPLFASPGSAWVEDATTAQVQPESDQQILTYYRVVCGDGSDLVAAEPGDAPILDVAFDEFTMPIFLAGSEAQKKKYIPRLTSGESLGAWGLNCKR